MQGAQLLLDTADPEEYEPSGQAVREDAPDKQKNPAEQDKHDEDPTDG